MKNDATFHIFPLAEMLTNDKEVIEPLTRLSQSVKIMDPSGYLSRNVI